jgi:hypothetical protein
VKENITQGGHCIITTKATTTTKTVPVPVPVPPTPRQ